MAKSTGTQSYKNSKSMRVHIILLTMPSVCFCVTWVECSSNNMIKLLRNFPIPLDVVSEMQLRILSIIVLKLHLVLWTSVFLIANLLKRLSMLLQVQYEICSVFCHQVEFLYADCTNAFIFLNGFPSPSFNIGKECAKIRTSIGVPLSSA